MGCSYAGKDMVRVGACKARCQRFEQQEKGGVKKKTFWAYLVSHVYLHSSCLIIIQFRLNYELF